MKKSLLVLMLVLVAVVLASAPSFAQHAEEAAKEASAPTPANWAFSKFLWATVALVFSVMGTSWAQSKIGVAGAGAMAEKPELAGTIIVLIAIPETMVILGFVIAAMIIFA